jgi:hypothetical protein
MIIGDDKNSERADESEKGAEKANNPAISQKKLEANRANAQRSSGPKTEQGKKHSRRNPMKHGLFASVLLVEEAERSEVYKKLLYDLIREYAEIGERGHIWVEMLAFCLWQERRIVQWEASIIREQNYLPADVSGVLQGEALERALAMPSQQKLDLLRRCQVANLAHIRFALECLKSLQSAHKREHIP